MKAIIRLKYGPPKVLAIKEVERPKPKRNELLVRVIATTVNRTDCGILFGKPFIIRFFTGLFKPKLLMPGTDFAGEVKEIGSEVKSFKVGDKVWGFDDNGLLSQAEYMTIPEKKAILTIPGNLSYEQAAASAEGAHYAYNFINKVTIIPAQKVLVNGATGAIGSAAVQFLKYYGVHVTAVCKGKHAELVKSLGADKIIDYTLEDFTSRIGNYDFVFDAVGKSTFLKCKRLLNKNGVYISSELGPYYQNPFLALVTPIFGGKKVKFPIPFNIRESLKFTQKLIEQGKFRPVIDKGYSMEKTQEAYTYVASGQKIGNVMLKIGEE